MYMSIGIHINVYIADQNRILKDTYLSLNTYIDTNINIHTYLYTYISVYRGLKQSIVGYVSPLIVLPH